MNARQHVDTTNQPIRAKKPCYALSRDVHPRKLTRGKGTFANALDGVAATVRNARWREVICAESVEA